MSPFAPARRENMIAWMAARCDEPNYGSWWSTTSQAALVTGLHRS